MILHARLMMGETLKHNKYKKNRGNLQGNK
jgi:hypothetical protein